MRLLIISAIAAAAAGLAAAPAVAGLAGNPSFSHQLPVQVPSRARAPQLADDRGRDGSGSSTSTRHAEPGDDKGSGRESGSGEDNGGATGTEPEPGHGTATMHAPEPGDDNGGATTTRAPEPSDDHGSGASSSDASGGHGGKG